MGNAVRRVGHGEERVPADLALEAGIPRLINGGAAILCGIEVADVLCDAERWAEGRLLDYGNRVRVAIGRPWAVPGDVASGSVHGKAAAEQRGHAHRSGNAFTLSVGAVESQVVDDIAGVHNRVLIDCVCEADVWADVLPVNGGAIEAGAAGAVAKRGSRARQVTRGRVFGRHVQPHVVVLSELVGNHHVPAQAGADGQLVVNLDVVLDVGRVVLGVELGLSLRGAVSRVRQT